MKNSIGLLFLLLFSGNNLLSQAYQKMIETGNRWNYIDYPPTISGGQYDGSYRMTYSCWISSDTIIGQTRYKNLMCDAITYERTRTYYAGALREDTVNKQVFIKLPGTGGDEQLAFTFNHAIGDTLRIDSFDNSQKRIRYLNAIDTVDIGDKRLRRFEICDAYYKNNFKTTPYYIFTDYWIEGVGSLKRMPDQLISPYWWPEDNVEEPALLCFWQKDEQIYKNPAYDSCVYTSPYSSVNKNIRNHEGIILYPNPVSGLLHVACAEPLLKIELLDMEGRLLRTTLRDEVDVSNLKEGIYFIQVTTGSGRTVTEPFIKHER